VQGLRNQYYKYQHLKRKQQWMKIICDNGYDKCSQCGYDKCFSAIDYHHPDKRIKGEKKIRIAELIHYIPTKERILELLKTKPLCSNCHREIHSVH
jgi:hypothetical protein